jgi:tRNA threonylcarbamoyladenosine modification (KEOPS) complex Cgi121 subunit
MITAFINENVDPRVILKTAQQEFKDATVQFVDLDRTAGQTHILFATYNALKSHVLGKMISRSAAIEILLYIAAERQIARAFERMGVQKNTRRVAVIATGSSEVLLLIEEYLRSTFNHECSDDLLDEWTEQRAATILKVFSVASNEIESVTRSGNSSQKPIQRLVIERSALLAVKR